jgi:hypothetical protein
MNSHGVQVGRGRMHSGSFPVDFGAADSVARRGRATGCQFCDITRKKEISALRSARLQANSVSRVLNIMVGSPP